METEVSDNGASSDPLGILAAILAKEREEVPLQAAYQAVLPSALTLAEAAEEEPMMSWDIGDVTPGTVVSSFHPSIHLSSLPSSPTLQIEASHPLQTLN